MTDGKSIATTETCSDADDIFIDAQRGRIYLSCGAGFLDVLQAKDAPTDRAYPHGSWRTNFALCARGGSSACCCPREFHRARGHLGIQTNALSQQPRH
jgi:hypothetical protein